MARCLWASSSSLSCRFFCSSSNLSFCCRWASFAPPIQASAVPPFRVATFEMKSQLELLAAAQSQQFLQLRTHLYRTLPLHLHHGCAPPFPLLFRPQVFLRLPFRRGPSVDAARVP